MQDLVPLGKGWEKVNKDLDGDKGENMGQRIRELELLLAFLAGRISCSGSLKGRSGVPDLALSLCHTRLIQIWAISQEFTISTCFPGVFALETAQH